MASFLRLCFPADLNTQNTWYTDANGRDMQKRVFNYRPTWKLNVTDPVSGNFYPVDSSIYAEEVGGRRLTIITDRAQGGASLANGELQLMVGHAEKRGGRERERKKERKRERE